MKLQPDRSDAPTITGYGEDWVSINGERLTHSLVLCSDGQRLAWPVQHFHDLASSHFELLAGLGMEVVLFGSGPRLRFPQPEWLRPLIAQRLGLETMDTAAACRTYNILAGEGRRVAVALLIEHKA